MGGEEIESSDELDQSHYFCRNNAYTRLTGGDGEVALVDKRDPKQTVSLEPWLATVFMLADGQHTVGELIGHLRGQYMEQPPAELERTILSVVERLVDSGTVRLNEAPIEPAYHLARPIEELDPEEAKRFLQEDGYYQLPH
ncbi:MAG: PqqD family peptide modification chaperone [Gammaproteobacteria bacterium]|uniref:PqqD family peptide modification chaperone n=1 Tax=Candidatus Thiopontia autotrophica TaxID=2841688 RepID=A0A8J6TWB6_9GAMM|nr:PqqD family peptide modification chaperone [Candidatus Thiopontia autotrophica]MBL6969186.1 PqqD family peptide modification chaperone [Gammaproteobacteria bacterium]